MLFCTVGSVAAFAHKTPLLLGGTQALPASPKPIFGDPSYSNPKSPLKLQCLRWPRGTRFPVPIRISGATLLNLTVGLPVIGPFALVASRLSYVVPPMVKVCPAGIEIFTLALLPL